MPGKPVNTETDSVNSKPIISITDARLRMILLSVLIMTFMMTLDSSILNVALPTLADSLNVPTSLIDWVCTSYLISMCAFSLIFGKIADIIGKTKVFQAGTVIFTLGSFLCSMSDSFTVLIISRLIQGFGASAAMSSNLGIISEFYPYKDRAKALSFVGSAVAMGIMVGPITGGAILNYFSWEVIFMINLPIGLIAFILGLIYLPKNSSIKLEGRFDLWGSLFIVITLSAIISSLTMMQTYSNIYLYLLLLSGFMFLFLFIQFEKKAEIPLVKIALFKNKSFVINLLSIAITFICIGLYNIMMPFYLQNALGYTPGRAGLIMITQPVIMVITAPVSGFFADKYGFRPVSALGMFIFGCGALIQGLVYDLDTSPLVIILGIIIFSLGNAICQTPNNALVMSSVPSEDYGFAGSIGSLVRYLGVSMGLTLSTCMLYFLMSFKAGYMVKDFLEDRPEIFIFGLRYVFICASIILWTASFLMAKAYIKGKNKHR